MIKFKYLYLFALIAVPLGALAQTLPTTREGTQIELSEADVGELKQWVQNAKFALDQLKETFRLLSTEQKLKLATSEFNRIVSESGPKSNELYVRYAINRALAVNDIVGTNTSTEDKESLLGLYVETIDLGLRYYSDDTKYLEAIGKGQTPPAEIQHPVVFGVEYANTLLAYSQTFLDPKTEYRITRTALGFLGNDLNSARNLNRAIFTEQIIKIQQLLVVFPVNPPETSQAALKETRKLKFEIRENLKSRIVAKLQNDLKLEVKAESPPEVLTTVSPLPTGQTKPAPAHEIKLGTAVFVAKDDRQNFADAKIVGLNNDTAVVKFNDGSKSAEKIVNLAFTKGCIEDLCVGANTYRTAAGSREDSSDVSDVKIVGITNEKQFILSYRGGRYDGQTAGFFDLNDLAKNSGCVGEFCVGQTVYNISGKQDTKIVGIDRNTNKFILEWTKDPYLGALTKGWESEDVIKTQE